LSSTFEAYQVNSCSYDGDPAWASAFIAMIDWVHRYHGNTAALAKHYAAASAYIDYLSAHYVRDLARMGLRAVDWTEE